MDRIIRYDGLPSSSRTFWGTQYDHLMDRIRISDDCSQSIAEPPPMSPAHRSRVALVTGAGSGIGRCVAEGLALGQGARVYVLDKDGDTAVAVVEAINAAGGRAKT